MKLKALAAIAVAGIMVMSVPMVAMAEDPEPVHKHCSISTPADETNVTASGDIAAVAASESVNCNVLKVKAEKNNAIIASSGATVKADSAENNSGDKATVRAAAATVEVKGDVKNNNTFIAIEAKDGSTVTAGSATNGVAGSNSSATVYAESNNFFATNTTVNVKGDVTNNGDGYAVSVASGATVVVEGTVDSYHDGHATANVDDNADTRLIVYEITNSKSKYSKIDGAGATSNVYYIIKGTDSAGISNVKGTTNQTVLAGTADEKTYKTAKYNEVITFSVTSGYELKEGNIKVTPNADGTYSITIPVGGGVTLEAIKKAIEQAQSSGNSSTAVFTSTPTSQGSASAPLTSGSWAQASEGKFTYTNNGEKLINCVAWIQYTDAQGQVVTGKYCFDNNGYMIVNTWKEVQSGVWNFFGADGKMVVNTTTPDGYVVDANGEWKK